MINKASYEQNHDSQTKPLCWYAENNYCTPHFHSSLEFAYILSGSMNALMDGQQVVVHQGDLLISPSYTIHTYNTLESSSLYVLIIPLNVIPALQPLLSKRTFSSYVLHPCDITEELVQSMEAIIAHLDSKHMKDKLLDNLLKGYSYVFMSLLIANVPLVNISNTKVISLAQDILLFIQENYTSSLTLDSLSKQFGYSRSRFSHIFHDYFGCNLTEYINGIRCRHANELLNDRSCSVAKAALSSGFESVRSFYRVHEQLYGDAPRQQRRQK